MPKHNNAIPRNHFHKHWNPESSQKGHIKTFFQQAKQKKARRVRRAAKAKAVFPRPVQALRPQVQCCTQRFNMKVRSGKGFTLDECKAAGVSPKFARTVGVAVDQRRKNHSEESLTVNSNRLKEYISKLVLYPLAGGKKSSITTVKPDASKIASVQQNTFPAPTVVSTAEAPRELTADEKSRHIYNYLRAQNRNTKFIGIRLARKVRKDKADKEKADGTGVKKGK